MLSDFLETLDSKKAFSSCESFFDINWRREAFFVIVKSDLLETSERSKGCVISSDALHFLNVFRHFKKKATILEFMEVLANFGKKWDDEYVRHHLRMYGDSFSVMNLMKTTVADDVITTPSKKIHFLPMFSDAEGGYEFLPDSAKEYSVERINNRVNSQNYISLSINDGHLASQGRDGEASMVS